MPEGPEIRIAADEIGKAIAGRVTTQVFFAFDRLKPFEKSLAGERVAAVESRGKAILIRFANGLNIFSHNQLYGKWIVCDANTYPNTNRQLRLAIHNPEKSALLFSASDIEVLRDEELASHPFLNKLGPDLLDESVTAEHVVDRFVHKSFYRRKFTSLLLDQQFLAGMGNYLRSEVMFVARIHPSLRPVDCTGQQIRRIAETTIKLTRQSYRTKGLTTDLQLVERLREQGYERSRYRFWVFNRRGEPCFVCGTPIVRDVIGGRRFYFCPTCQAKD